MLQEFASDGTVLRPLLDFALPPHRHKKAALVKPLLQSTAAGKLKTQDDSDTLDIVRLAAPTAARMAEAFFQFLQQWNVMSRVAAMPNGQIRSLCLPHTRLS